MELVNQSFADVKLHVGAQDGDTRARTGVVIAKATFRVADGRAHIDDESPYPVLERDAEVALGVLPQDVGNSFGPGFEVMVLGAAYAPTRTPIAEHLVRLTLGSETHCIRVVGDREWVNTGDTWHIPSPRPFVRMPLTWERAFGGTVDVWIDEHSVVPARDWRNPYGRGYHPEKMVSGVIEQWGAPPTFPRWEDRPALPNLERIDAPVCTRDDEPEPICWAPMPKDCGLRLTSFAAAQGFRIGEPLPDRKMKADPAEMWWRSHPSLRYSGSPCGHRVRLEGCRPNGSAWEFVVPPLELGFDFAIGAQGGSRALEPKRLVLLPEEERFYLVYSKRFAFAAGAEDGERSIRIWARGR
jgi:hypothetical protein